MTLAISRLPLAVRADVGSRVPRWERQTPAGMRGVGVAPGTLPTSGLALAARVSRLWTPGRRFESGFGRGCGCRRAQRVGTHDDAGHKTATARRRCRPPVAAGSSRRRRGHTQPVVWEVFDLAAHPVGLWLARSWRPRRPTSPATSDRSPGRAARASVFLSNGSQPLAGCRLACPRRPR